MPSPLNESVGIRSMTMKYEDSKNKVDGGAKNAEPAADAKAKAAPVAEEKKVLVQQPTDAEAERKRKEAETAKRKAREAKVAERKAKMEKMVEAKSEIAVNIMQYNVAMKKLIDKMNDTLECWKGLAGKFRNQRGLAARWRMSERVVNSSIRLLSGNKMQVWMINDDEIENEIEQGDRK